MRYVLTDKDRARSQAGRKCSTDNCWHRPRKGYLRCPHCIDSGTGPCGVVPPMYRPTIERAIALLAKEEANQRAAYEKN